MPSYNKKRILTAAQKNLQYYQDTFFSFIPLSLSTAAPAA